MQDLRKGSTALLVLHVTFGVLQGEGSPVYLVATGLGLMTVLGMHVRAAKIERPLDEPIGGRTPVVRRAACPQQRMCRRSSAG